MSRLGNEASARRSSACRKGARKPLRSIAKPRTRLAGALRKLEETLASDHQDFARRAREFSMRFHDYSPLNRALIFLQRPAATFVKGRKQWERGGRIVKKGTCAIQILAPVLDSGQTAKTSRFSPVKVYDVSDTDGAPVKVPVLAPDAQGQEELVGRRLASLEEWVRRSGLDLLYKAPLVNTLVDGATDGQTIWIRPDLKPAERLLVIAHEIAHVKLHFKRKQQGELLFVDADAGPPSPDARELEAELTAFLLLAFSGIDSSCGSASYLASWRASMKKVREHTERAFVAACSVIRDCEEGRY